MKYRQYELHAADSRLVCWLESNAKMQPDTRLTLKEIPDVIWTVIRVFGPALDAPPLKRWNVGGLP